MAFQLSKRSGAMMWSVGAAAVCNVLLNYWWIQSFGTIGAAWATTVSYAIALGVCIAIGRRLLPIQLDWSQTLRIACASGFMVLVIVSMPALPGLPGLCAQIGAGVAAYGIAGALLNVMGARTYLANRLGLLP